MKDVKKRTIVCIVCIIVFFAGYSLAQDWPQWRGSNRDAKVTGFTVPAAWPEQLTQKWKVNVGLGCSTPALVGDKLYVFVRREAEEVALCLDAGNGNILWEDRDKYEAVVVEGGASRGFTGPRSSPTVADGKVVTFGVGGILSCFDADTGKLLWRKDDFPGAWPKFYTSMSPMIVDGLCMALLGGPDNGAIIAYDLTNGQEKWKWTGDYPAYASPALMTVDNARMVIAPTEKYIVAISPGDGKLCWQRPFAVIDRGMNASTPVIDGQIVYYGGTDRGIIAVKVRKESDGFVADELWRNTDNSVEFNTPVLKNGLLFCLSQRGAFFCVNAETGRTLWTHPSGSRGAFGSIVDAGSVLLALTPQSQLLVLEPNDKEYKELARYKIADSETYAYPVIAGNRVFIKDQESVTLWTIE